MSRRGETYSFIVPLHSFLSNEALVSPLLSREILSEMSSNITLFAYMLYDKNGLKKNYLGEGGKTRPLYMSDSFCKR